MFKPSKRLRRWGWVSVLLLVAGLLWNSTAGQWVGSVLSLGAGLVKAAPVDQPALHHMQVGGTPVQIGQAVGQKFKPLIQNWHKQFVTLGVAMTFQSKEALYEKARQLGKHLHADDVAELRGLADGAGLTYEDVLYLNTFYHLTAERLACRQLAAWGDATTDGKLIHARNLDWHDYPGSPLHANHLALTVKPDGGRTYLMLTWPALQSVLTGTNEAGISIAFNQLRGSGKRAPESEPVFFTLKRILRTCGTLEEAIDTLKKTNPFGNGSVCISDARARKAVVVEFIDGKMGVREAAPGDKGSMAACMIGNANHLTKESGVTGPSATGRATSPTCEVAATLGGKLDSTKMIEVMRHQRVLQRNNLLSVVFEPEENRMRLAVGGAPAGKGTYLEFKLFEKPFNERSAPSAAAGAIQNGKAP